MVTLLRNEQRRHLQCGEHDVWQAFYASDHPGALAHGIGFLVAFDEFRLPPGESTAAHSDDEAEVVTYLHEGALSQEDTAGNSSVIHAGEFQRMSTGRIRHKETSVSRSDWAHIFRMGLRPSQVGIERDQEQKRFTAAQRRNVLCVVASPDGRKGSLRIHQDALVFSAIVEPGHHLIHALEPGRSAWLHVVCGEATLDEVVLTRGDSVGATTEPSISMTVQMNTELLLIDMGPVPLSLTDVVGL